MTKATQFCEFPKPWHISLVAIWQDDKKHYPSLRRFVTRPGSLCRVATDHLLIPPQCWHFTVLAIMQINQHPPAFNNMREFARWALCPIRTNFNVVEALRASFRPFTATLDEVRCYDNGTVLQFKYGETLKMYRDQARALLRTPVSLLVRAHSKSQAGRRFKKEWGIPIIQSMLDDPTKNFGQRTFGSIARSPSRHDGSSERWHKWIYPTDRKELVFERIHLLVSDEMLANPRCADEDVVIESSSASRSVSPLQRLTVQGSPRTRAASECAPSA